VTATPADHWPIVALNEIDPMRRRGVRVMRELLTRLLFLVATPLFRWADRIERQGK
jgi:hypothetical protein